MKILFSFICILCLFSCSQEKEKYIYILSRYSQSKEGDLVLKFNNNNLKISHIGLSLDNTIDSRIYNISYNEKNSEGSSLLQENRKKFWNSPDVKDNRIWKLKVSATEYNKIKIRLDSMTQVKYYFDLNPKTFNGLYCSEFVYQVLENANHLKFNQNKKCVKLNVIERIFVQDSTLCYYAADFFLKYQLKEIKK
ncbi:hypothetical protein [Frigoriflavimonas asaccharolytica]|uniref:Permuted papain-like amidase YaeF/Yiix C92 family enzyme n=1 Tax=Frigoriflavimonas asaccharolytica TaxID=2735899 RepID=A0A8J8K9J1_9FLAO|nr:hypothetical protein [Frigoriflavimonas asaccharolytica]NRS93706.1 hypothetical protein [Frigoriflavimonas asaccharolytica]